VLRDYHSRHNKLVLESAPRRGTRAYCLRDGTVTSAIQAKGPNALINLLVQP
jgi:hypothetical protein